MTEDGLFSYSLDDSCVHILCECNEESILVCSEGNIYRCSACGRGYRTEIEVKVFMYQSAEKDENFREHDEVQKEAYEYFDKLLGRI